MIAFLLGLTEWFIASQRTWSISRGDSLKAAGWVFVENALGFAVLFKAIENRTVWFVLAYCLGASLGTFINLQTDL